MRVIRVKTNIGLFSIVNGDLVTENDRIESVFKDFVEPDGATPSEGPIDYAIAKELSDLLGEGFEIVSQDYSDSEAGVIY